MAEISVCIVTYNNADKIGAVLSSIYAVTKTENVSVFVSDNASEDGTVDIVKKSFPEVRILENGANLGFGAANNKAIPFLESKYHFIVNPDIFIKTDVFAEFSDYFENNPEVAMAIPKLLYENGEEQFTPKLTPKLRYMLGGRLEKYGKCFKKWREEYTLRNKTITEPIEVGFCSGCFICIRTELFKKLGGFDERYFLYNEDADLTREAKKYGKTMYIPEISVIHSWERGYTKSNKLFLIQIQSMFKYFWKWKGAV